MQSKCKQTSRKKQGPSRACPVFGESQRNEILSMLRRAGPAGVSRAFLIFEKHFTQCGSRIFELQRMGCAIRSEDRGGRYPTWYLLESEPLELRPRQDPRSAETNRGQYQASKNNKAGMTASESGQNRSRNCELPLFDSVRP
jgi:hypothetical protein